jgi:hypothetical protein
MIVADRNDLLNKIEKQLLYIESDDAYNKLASRIISIKKPTSCTVIEDVEADIINISEITVKVSYSFSWDDLTNDELSDVSKYLHDLIKQDV